MHFTIPSCLSFGWWIYEGAVDMSHFILGFKFGCGRGGTDEIRISWSRMDRDFFRSGNLVPTSYQSCRHWLYLVDMRSMFYSSFLIISINEASPPRVGSQNLLFFVAECPFIATFELVDYTRVLKFKSIKRFPSCTYLAGRVRSLTSYDYVKGHE